MGTLFVLGYAARYVPPAAEWRLQLAALALPLSAAATVGLSAVWLSRRGRRSAGWWVGAGVHVLLVGAVALRFRPVLGGADAEGGAGVDLQVLSLNAGEGGGGAYEAMQALLREVEPDVIAFQEAPVQRVNRGEAEPVLTGPAALLASLASGYALPTTEELGQVPILAREPIVSYETGELGQSGDDAASRYARAVIERDGSGIVIYNVHLRSFNEDRPSGLPTLGNVREWLRAVATLRRDFILRAREAERLRALVEREHLPVVVLGDLNTTPHQWVYAVLADDFHDALTYPSGWPLTYPDRRPLVRIDAVLASPEWRVRSAAVGPPGLSDHRAVLASLKLPEAS